MTEYEALLRLQDIDLELMRDSRTLKSMPQQRKIAAIDQAKRKVQGELTKIVGQRKDAQTEVSDLEKEHASLLEAADEARAQAAEGKGGYREAQSLEDHLTSLAKRTEKAEYRHGERMAQLEKAERAEKNARDLIARLDEERATQKESFDRASADVMARVRTLAAERKRMVALLEPKTLERYDAAAKRFGGLAVERLRGNVPSVCRVKLQPSVFADLRKEGAIAECPYCHRILVTEEVSD